MMNRQNVRIHRLVLGFALAILLADGLAGDRGLIATVRARKERRTLTAEIASLRTENANLRRRAQALKNDPATIEAVARQELGLLRRDEKIVIVIRR
jgi:cell division protein FtsB